jgi:putative transcriptional regulator
MAKKDIGANKDAILKLKQEIAGEICISGNSGNTLKKWQNIFEISQISLARQMKLTGSTISDYENGRRNNPSINFVQRFVNALIDIDLKRKAQIIKKLITLPIEQVVETKEFKKGIKVKHTDGLKDLEQINLKNPNELVFGITYLDAFSIPEFESNDLQKIFGKTNKRILYIQNAHNTLAIHLFLKSLKLATNMNPGVLVLETALENKDEILKTLDINVPIYISTKLKDEIKQITKDL